MTKYHKSPHKNPKKTITNHPQNPHIISNSHNTTITLLPLNFLSPRVRFQHTINNTLIQILKGRKLRIIHGRRGPTLYLIMHGRTVALIKHFLLQFLKFPLQLLILSIAKLDHLLNLFNRVLDYIVILSHLSDHVQFTQHLVLSNAGLLQFLSLDLYGLF